MSEKHTVDSTPDENLMILAEKPGNHNTDALIDWLLTTGIQLKVLQCTLDVY